MFHILFTRKKIQVECVLKINNIQIKRVPLSKYLGVVIDENLTWSKHITGIISKITRFAGIFYKLRDIIIITLFRHISQHTIKNKQ